MGAVMAVSVLAMVHAAGGAARAQAIKGFVAQGKLAALTIGAWSCQLPANRNFGVSKWAGNWYGTPC